MATQGNISNKGAITNPYLYTNVWGCKWTGDVTYTFGSGLSPTSPYGVTVSEPSVAWSAPEQQAVRDMLQNYMNVCNVRFVETTFDSANPANLVAYKVTSNVLGIETSGMFEVPNGSKSGPNTLNGYFNTSHADWSNFAVGGSGFELLMHEFGHSVGLAHPHDGGIEALAKPYPGINIIEKDYRDMGDNNLNQGIWSTMSYNDGWLKTASGASTGLEPASDKSYGYQATPMAFDVAALQFLYGANMQYHTGDDTYTLVQNNAVGTSWACIWDAGGNDTITNAGATLGCTIDLREATLTNSPNGGGYVSYDLGIHGGLTIANGAIIENAIGGGATDTLMGNAVMNLLRGNAGNDALDGGANIDTAAYTGSKVQYAINRAGGTVSDTVADRDGIDTLISMERLKFSDTMVGLDVGKGENTGEIYRLYLTVLARNPQADAVGCGFWIDKLDKTVLSIDQVVGSFLNSQEFVARFGSSTSSNDSFVNLLYQNLLGRDGHSDPGFNFWLDALNNHRASREQVVVGFMESPENVTNAAPLIGDTPTYQQWTA